MCANLMAVFNGLTQPGPKLRHHGLIAGGHEQRRLYAVPVHSIDASGQILISIVHGVGDDGVSAVQVLGLSGKLNLAGGITQLFAIDSQPKQRIAIEDSDGRRFYHEFGEIPAGQVAIAGRARPPGQTSFRGA